MTNPNLGLVQTIDKGASEGGWKGQNSHQPGHTIGPMEAQTSRNCHFNSSTNQKCVGFQKSFNQAAPPPGLYFRNDNVDVLTSDSTGVGVVSYARIPHHADFNFSTAWSIEFYIELQETPSVDACLLSKGDETTADRTFEIYVDTSRNVRIEFDTAGGVVSETSTTAIALDTPTRLTIRRLNTQLSFFFGGAVDNQPTIVSDANASNAQPIIIGGRLTDQNTDNDFGPQNGHIRDAFKGILDDLRIWDTSISGANIAARDDRELRSDETDNANLVGYWKMNEGSGTTFACDENATNPSTKTGTFFWIGPQYVTGLVDENETGAWEFDGRTRVGIIAKLAITYEAFASTIAAFTVEFNINPDDVARAQTLIGMSNDTAVLGTTTCFHVGINAIGKIEFKYYDGTSLRTLTSGSAIVAGNHYHIAVIRDVSAVGGYESKLIVWDITSSPDNRGTGSGYDVVTASNGTGAPAAAQRTTVGMYGTANDYTTTPSPDPFDGVIDEIRFWSTDRSTFNGQDLVVRHGNGSIFRDDSGLIGYWPLDDNRPDFNLGDPIAASNESSFSNALIGFPNTYTPVFANGLVPTWDYDSNEDRVNGKSDQVNMIRSFAVGSDDEEVYVAAGCDLYRFTGAGNRTTIYRGLAKDTLVDAAVHADHMYLCNGVDQNLALIDGEVFKMGLNRPGPIVFAQATATTTGFTGKRKYVYTHYDERTGYESSISDDSLVIDRGAVVGGSVLQVFPTANPRITHIRIYATISNTVGPQNVFYRLAEIPNIPRVEKGFNVFLAAVVDDVTDVILSTRVTIDLDRDPPPVFKYMRVYQDRIYGVAATFPNRLYNSQLPNLLTAAHAEAFSALGFTNYEENNGDIITALGIVRSKLVVGKSTSVWEQPIGGTQGIPLRPIPRHENHGIVSHWSWANIDLNLAVYLSTKGFYVYDGVEYRYVSRPVENIVESLKEVNLPDAYGAHYRQRQSYMCSVTLGDGTKEVLSFDYRDGGWTRRTNWQAVVLQDVRAIRGRTERFLFGDENGYVHLYDRSPADQENQGAADSPNVSGTATGGGASNVRDSGAAWPTADDGLRGVLVTIEDADTGADTTHLIVSNTDVQLDFGDARATDVVLGDKYRVGQIDWAWQSRDEHVRDTVSRERWMWLEIHGKASNEGTMTVAFTPEKTNALTKEKTVDVATDRRVVKTLINLRATFLSISFQDKEPNSTKELESYAIGVIPEGRGAQVTSTGVTS